MKGHVNWCPTCGRTDNHPDMQAPAPISGEAGADSAIAIHSIGPASEKQGVSTITTPSVQSDVVAKPSYSQGLSTREHRLVRQLAEARLSWAEGKHDAAWFLEAAYAVADLVPILKCGGCEKLFIQRDGRQRKWCSERCRYRMGMRARRARIKAASWEDAT